MATDPHDLIAKTSNYGPYVLAIAVLGVLIVVAWLVLA